MTSTTSTDVYDVLTPRRGGACKTSIDNSHYRQSIQHAKGELSGFSRMAGDISPEVRRAIIDLIVDEAVRRGHSLRDIAYVLLIARLESGFNPDAANCNSTAAGVMEVTDITAEDIVDVTSKRDWEQKNPQDVRIDITKAEDRFNARKNIVAGIIQFERCKARAMMILNTSDRSIYEERVYQYYHAGLYFDGGAKGNPKKIDKYGLEQFKQNILPLLNPVEAALQKYGKFQATLTQPNGKPYSGVEYLAFIPRKLSKLSIDRIFDWAARLFGKSPASKNDALEDKNTSAATAQGNTPPSAPPAESSPS